MKHPLRLSLILIALATFALPSCSFMYPNKPYLPSRSGIQQNGSVTVKPNENIYAIAREHNVSMRDLIVLNDLKPPFEVSAGQTLALPAGGSFGNDMPAPASAPLSPVEKNDLSPIEPASVSQENLEPITVAPAPASPTPSSSARSGLSPFGTGPSVPAPIPQPPPVAAVQPAQATAQPEPVTALNHPSAPQKQVATTMGNAGDTTDFVWPVQGPILSAYGAKGPGLNNDGVNIGAPKGAPVVASAPGTVVYAGNEMKGFGNLVLIRHAGDRVTAYAHLERVLVKKDSVVGQGDMIGTVGKTGNVPTPQLHFEVREGGKPVDPAQIVKGEPSTN